MTQVSGNSTWGKPAKAIASYIQTALTQLAHAAARAKETYLSTLYQRLAARRGRKRATIAVAHAMVARAFHRLSRHEPYHELGANYVDEQRRDHLLNH